MDNPPNLSNPPQQNSPKPAPLNPNLFTSMSIETINDISIRMELEPSPVKQNIMLKPDLPGKMSPMKLIKSSPNKQDLASFNQPEEHITIIFSSFKDAIRNADLPRLKEILRKKKKSYQNLKNCLFFFIKKNTKKDMISQTD